MLSTINKIRNIFALLYVFLVTPVMAGMIFLEIKENPIYTNDYLEWKNPDSVPYDFKPIRIKIYDNPNLSGVPYLEFKGKSKIYMNMSVAGEDVVDK